MKLFETSSHVLLAIFVGSSLPRNGYAQRRGDHYELDERASRKLKSSSSKKASREDVVDMKLDLILEMLDNLTLADVAGTASDILTIDTKIDTLVTAIPPLPSDDDEDDTVILLGLVGELQTTVDTVLADLNSFAKERGDDR